MMVDVQSVHTFDVIQVYCQLIISPLSICENERLTGRIHPQVVDSLHYVDSPTSLVEGLF